MLPIETSKFNIMDEFATTEELQLLSEYIEIQSGNAKARSLSQDEMSAITKTGKELLRYAKAINLPNSAEDHYSFSLPGNERRLWDSFKHFDTFYRNLISGYPNYLISQDNDRIMKTKIGEMTGEDFEKYLKLIGFLK